ncbi:MAG TPA: cupredoxin domain-containing protein, partial [Anaerolineae bacterium]|nr:cupredoxin domain-containing protein [Anaerolineae bacterium]
DEPGMGGANGAPAVYMVNGRQYVVNAFGGNAQVRSGQPSPTGDALIAFALPQPGEAGPNVVRANPKQVPTGDIPESDLQATLPSPPADARVIEIHMNQIFFYPNELTAQPSEKLALHLINSEAAGLEHNVAIALETGVTGLKETITAGEDGYFVFTAPDTPGDYTFWCNVGEHKELGMQGTLTVASAVAEAAETTTDTAAQTSGEVVETTTDTAATQTTQQVAQAQEAPGTLPVTGGVVLPQTNLLLVGLGMLLLVGGVSLALSSRTR